MKQYRLPLGALSLLGAPGLLLCILSSGIWLLPICWRHRRFLCHRDYLRRGLGRHKHLCRGLGCSDSLVRQGSPSIFCRSTCCLCRFWLRSGGRRQARGCQAGRPRPTGGSRHHLRGEGALHVHLHKEVALELDQLPRGPAPLSAVCAQRPPWRRKLHSLVGRPDALGLPGQQPGLRQVARPGPIGYLALGGFPGLPSSGPAWRPDTQKGPKLRLRAFSPSGMCLGHACQS
mmetsp:Transcript_31655/g.67237  ORF Transcript_31655/g.67237 Transcript_31655/m.67237 type:complete len:231 (-) Transcript_31655:1-693(-)